MSKSKENSAIVTLDSVTGELLDIRQAVHDVTVHANLLENLTEKDTIYVTYLVESLHTSVKNLRGLYVKRKPRASNKATLTF